MRLHHPFLLSLLLACSSNDPLSPPDAGTQMDANLGPCLAPAHLPDDPLTVRADVDLKRHSSAPTIVHMLDIARSDSGTLFLVGTGGLFVVEADQTRFVQTELWPGGVPNRGAAFHKITLLPNDLLATSNRDHGVVIVDVAGQPTVLGTRDLLDASGMGTIDHYLMVLTHSGSLVTLEISDPSAPNEVARTSGLGNPWAMVINDRMAYIVDNTLGLVTFDLTDPEAPVLRSTQATNGAAQDIDLHDGKLFLALGAAGIAIYSLQDPTTPTFLDAIDFGRAVVSVSASSGRVWGATQEGIVVADTDPHYLAAQRTDEWAMSIIASGSTAHVADWSHYKRFELQPAQAPEGDPEQTELYFLGELEQRLSLKNRGNADLLVVGAAVDDARFQLTVDRTTVAPNEAATFTLSHAPDGNAIDAELCIATNDPDEPLLKIALRDGSEDAPIGEEAPLFELPLVSDDNVTHRLIDQRGHPVVLIYFASW